MKYGLRTKLNLWDVCFFVIGLEIPLLVVEHLNNCLPDRRKAREVLQYQLKQKIGNIMSDIGFAPPTRVEMAFRIQREFYTRNDLVYHILIPGAIDLTKMTIIAVDFDIGFHFKVVSKEESYFFFFAVDQTGTQAFLPISRENWFERLSKELHVE